MVDYNEHEAPVALNINFFVASKPIMSQRNFRSSVGRLSSVIYFAHTGSGFNFVTMITPFPHYITNGTIKLLFPMAREECIVFIQFSFRS